MHDLIVSILMLLVLALAPWVASATATRAVARFGIDQDPTHADGLQPVD